MTKNKILYLLLVLSFSFQILAQQSAIYTNSLADYQKALALYNNQQYAAAQTLFKQVNVSNEAKTLQSDCAYYIASCAVKLNQSNADSLMEEFVLEHPTSIKTNAAYLEGGHYYFATGNYANAKKWYDKVDEKALSDKEKQKFYFNNGYAVFSAKEYKLAKTYFAKVENSKEFGEQAKYYIGFMAYESDDYEQANKYFEQVSGQERYKDKLSYYKADLNFKLGKFDKAIEYANERLAQTKDKQEVSELSKIVGESYFNLQKYAEAIPYLKTYKGKKGDPDRTIRWGNTDYYQLGYAYYKQADYENAILEFNKIIGGNDVVAQNAYYHLGESYVRLNKKQEALNAFKNASELNFNLKIQEDSWLNYAKISYDIGNPYQSVPEVLINFLEKYPNTSYKEDIEFLLIDSYITSKNYIEALKLLEGRNGFEDKKVYQKVAFYRAIELFNEANFSEAKLFFETSLKASLDSKFKARALFWKAEADYNLSNFEDALIGFKDFEQQAESSKTAEIKNLNYNLAYTYFKLKKYTNAITHFNQFVSKKPEDKLRLNDAYLRLGDAYFVSSHYQNAVNAYDDAIKINEIEADYAAFQKAISLGYLGQSSKKIAALEQFITKFPKSNLCDDAIYELGNTYVKVSQTDKALVTYNRLISDYKTSSFMSATLLREGLIYYNTENNELALTKLKKVATDYPGTSEAVQAVSTARLIYIDLGRVNEYAVWVKQLDYVEVTDADLDNTSYEAAEKQYLENNTEKAITQFNSYLNSFPKGIHALNAHFYLAQLYTKQDLKANAKPHLEYVIQDNHSEFTEEALFKLSQIHLENKEWNNALPILKRLEAEAHFYTNTIFAQSNLMKAYYQLESYNEAVTYAEKVLLSSKIDNKIKSDAQVIIARSAMKTGNENRAKTAYEQVEKVATGENAAEALYYNAYFKNIDGNYEASNQSVQKLAKDFSGYKYYSAKGLVLMAKNFYALNDAFQATYILESVIENFKSFEDVVQEAQLELNNIKIEEAKTNASVLPVEN